MREHDSKRECTRCAVPRRELTLYDSVCIIVGIIIGAGIYRTTPDIAANAPSVAALVAVWLVGGAFSLIGAVCYAELATAYPNEGGDYVYLTRALGRPVGFLFAWCQLWIVRPGSIGVMAYAFADFANRIWPQAKGEDAGAVLVAYAVAAIVVLTAVNVLGVREGKWTQNILTTAKVLGLMAIVGIGFACTGSSTASPRIATETHGSPFGSLGLAMIFVLFTYGGWNEMAFVAAEVREPDKNILRSLLLGTVAVTGVYVLVNLAFVHALGLAAVGRAKVPAADVLELAIGPWAGQVICLLICISALSAVNGQIFTGSRIYYAMGAEHRLYACLGRWNARRGTPVASLLIQGTITVALTVWFGLAGGEKGFEKMIVFTTPGFWLFLALVGASLIVLRQKEPAIARTYRVPGYPFTPVLFSLGSACMAYFGLAYAIKHHTPEALWSSIVVLLTGTVAAIVDAATSRRARE
ncbi:MAG: amino acid permease [Planctomycetaceae bacterium]|nr:amino acid permease [Planctomycetaceae bacterium]